MGLQTPFVARNGLNLEFRTTAGFGAVASALNDHPYEFERGDVKRIRFEYAFNAESETIYDVPEPERLYDDVTEADVCRIFAEFYPLESDYILELHTHDIYDPVLFHQLTASIPAVEAVREKEITVFGGHLLDVPHPLLEPGDIIDLLDEKDGYRTTAISDDDDDLTLSAFEHGDIRYAFTPLGEVFPREDLLHVSNEEIQRVEQRLNADIINSIPSAPGVLDVQGLPSWWGGSVVASSFDDRYEAVAGADLSSVFLCDDYKERWRAAQQVFDGLDGFGTNDFDEFGYVYLDLLEAISFGLDCAEGDPETYYDAYGGDETVYGNIITPDCPGEPTIDRSDFKRLGFHDDVTMRSVIKARELFDLLAEHGGGVKTEPGIGESITRTIDDAIEVTIDVGARRATVPGFYCPTPPTRYGTITDVEVQQETGESIRVVNHSPTHATFRADGELFDVTVGDIEPIFDRR